MNEEQILDYRKYYEFAYEIFNQNNTTSSLSNITPYSSVTQYPYYRHYFDDFSTNKQDMTSTSFSKAKKPGSNKEKTSAKSTIGNRSQIHDK